MWSLTRRVAAVFLIECALAAAAAGVVAADRSSPRQDGPDGGWGSMAVAAALGVLATLLVYANGPPSDDRERAKPAALVLIVAVLGLAAAAVLAVVPPDGPLLGDRIRDGWLGLVPAAWLAIASLGLAGLALAGAVRSRELADWRSGWIADALIRLAPLALTVATATTLLLDDRAKEQSGSIAPEWDRYAAPPVGLVVGMATAVAFALLYRGDPSARRANRQIVAELVRRLDHLGNRLDDWCPDEPDGRDPIEIARATEPAGSRGLPDRQAACRSARMAHRAVSQALGNAGGADERAVPTTDDATWLFGAVGNQLVVQLQMAEQALLLIAPPEELPAVWRGQETWLAGSSIPRDLPTLRKATKALDRSQPQDRSVPAPAPQGDRAAEDQWRARVVLRDLRRNVDDCRTARRAALLRAGTGLCVAALFTSSATFALVAVAVVAGSARTFVFAAGGVFLVGCAVGVFCRLWLECLDMARTEDGLASAVVHLRHLRQLWVLAACWTVLLSALVVSALGDIDLPTKALSAIVIAAVVLGIAISTVTRFEPLRLDPAGPAEDIDQATALLRPLPLVAGGVGVIGVVAFFMLYAALADPVVRQIRP